MIRVIYTIIVLLVSSSFTFAKTSSEHYENTIKISVNEDARLFSKFKFDSIIENHKFRKNDTSKVSIEVIDNLNVQSANLLTTNFDSIFNSLSLIEDTLQKSYLTMYFTWLVELTGIVLEEELYQNSELFLRDNKNSLPYYQRINEIHKEYYKDNQFHFSMVLGLGGNNVTNTFGSGLEAGTNIKFGMGVEKAKFGVELGIHYFSSSVNKNNNWNISPLPDSLISSASRERSTNMSFYVKLRYNIYNRNRVSIVNNVGYSWATVDIDDYDIKGIQNNSVFTEVSLYYLLGSSSHIDNSSELFGLLKSESVIKINWFLFFDLGVKPFDFNRYILGTGVSYWFNTGLRITM